MMANFLFNMEPTNNEDWLRLYQEVEWELMLAEAGDPGIVIVSKPVPYEDNGSGINPEW